MLVHLSKTSPYVCDLSLGPIEQANRMASAPTKQSIPFLELKESFPKQTRTPLKLLAPDEVPMDSSIATTTTTDINTSRQQSLQPVWYTEQTIVDDNNEQYSTSMIQEQRYSMKSPGHRTNLTCSTLPTIESNSPEIEDEIIETPPLFNQPSLMRKSSTFTIEQQQPSMHIHSPLNESEKENDTNNIITSTQEDPANVIRHPTEPSDESFRALEHLLGLGSTNVNLTMTTTAHESPKSNHESLSLTIVTPTELINQTTTSLHLSYAPAGGGSLPSSQNILLMPTIESITEPSMNSTMPAPFLVDNSDMEEPSSTGGTVIDQETQNENFNCTEGSFHFTDEDEEKLETPKDDTNTEEENNFSFELNDFPNTTDESTTSTIETAPPPPPPMITIRAPTCADVAYRALIKPRAGGRMCQPHKTDSPLANSNKIKLTVRSSVPIPSPTPTARVLRSSSRRTSTDIASQNSTIQVTNVSNSIPNDECFVNENKLDDDYPRIELVEVVSLSEEDELEQEKAAGITLNLTSSPTSAEEADRSASSSSSYLSTQQDIATPTEQMQPVLSREFTYNTPTARTTRLSDRRRSIVTNRRSYALIPPIEEQQTTITEEEKDNSSDNASICSIRSSMLSRLSTNPTAVSEAPGIILQKSLAGSASPSPNPTPIITVRPSERLSSNLSPRRNINPLHSSTPSIRNKSLQMVSIGEQEQVSTTVPQPLNIDLSTEDVEMNDNEQQVDITINIQHVTDEGIQTSPEPVIRRIDIGVQTTPSLDPSSRRHFNTIEQQTTPIVTRSSSTSSCQTTPIVIPIQRTNTQQTSPVVQTSSKMVTEEKQITPMHSKAIMHLRRNVRFQFTPSTDARLAAKEKQEAEQQEIVVDKPKQILSDNEREEDTEDEIKKNTKTKKKIATSKKKKLVPSTIGDESSEEINESPVQQPIRRTTRNKSQKDTTDDEQQKTNDTHVTSTTNSMKKLSKRSARDEKKSSPIKELPLPEPEIIVTTTSPPLPTKRANRKRPNPKTIPIPPPETTSSPTEPVIKRAKTTKTTEVKQPVRVPSPEPPSTRNRSKTPVLRNNKKEAVKSASSSESVERQPIVETNTSKRRKKTSIETSPIESVAVSTNNKRKNNPISTIKKGKRRLHSVEQDEGLNTADEEETIQIISPPIEATIPVNDLDLNQEEREKIEAFTVVELKTRLTTHGENIPKGARKADLVALLIKIETNLLKERKETETAVAAVPTNTTSRKTRRKK